MSFFPAMKSLSLDREIKQISAPTDKVHRLKDQPLANRNYKLMIDGDILEGLTSPDGLVEVEIQPDAGTATLMVGDESSDDDLYQFELMLGELNPAEHVSGVQQRLTNLGFDCGAIDGVLGPATRTALAHFQDFRGLDITWELDAVTRNRLEDDHLS